MRVETAGCDRCSLSDALRKPPSRATHRKVRSCSKVTEIRLVYHGSAEVEIDSDNKVEIKDGAFLGEMAFVSGKPASGKVTTKTDLRQLSWTFHELRQLFRRNPEIRSAFQAVISSDLASKLTGR